jgi:hypothetical protein
MTGSDTPNWSHAVADRFEPLAHRHVLDGPDHFGLEDRRDLDAARHLELREPVVDDLVKHLSGRIDRGLELEPVAVRDPLERGRRETLLGQIAADALHGVIDLGPYRVLGVHLEHEVDAALEVEPEVDPLVERQHEIDGEHRHHTDEPPAPRELALHRILLLRLAGAEVNGRSVLGETGHGGTSYLDVDLRLADAEGEHVGIHLHDGAEDPSVRDHAVALRELG